MGWLTSLVNTDQPFIPLADYLADKKPFDKDKKKVSDLLFWNQQSVIVAGGASNQVSWTLPTLTPYLDFEILTIYASCWHQPAIAGLTRFHDTQVNIFSAGSVTVITDALPASGWNGFASSSNINFDIPTGASEISTRLTMAKGAAITITVSSYGALAINDATIQSLLLTFRII
jgi:hypothetical protein